VTPRLQEGVLLVLGPSLRATSADDKLTEELCRVTTSAPGRLGARPIEQAPRPERLRMRECSSFARIGLRSVPGLA